MKIRLWRGTAPFTLFRGFSRPIVIGTANQFTHVEITHDWLLPLFELAQATPYLKHLSLYGPTDSCAQTHILIFPSLLFKMLTILGIAGGFVGRPTGIEN